MTEMERAETFDSKEFGRNWFNSFLHIAVREKSFNKTNVARFLKNVTDYINFF
jgi:hypothetical protein